MSCPGPTDRVDGLVDLPMSGRAFEPRMSVRSSVAADFRESRWWQRLLLVATLGWIVYEWGAGNETVTPWLLVRVISETEGLRSVVMTAVVGFAFTTAQQLASGFTTAAGFSMFERTSLAAWNRLRGRLNEVPGDWAAMRWPARGLMVFALGTTAVVLIQIAVSGRADIRDHRRTVVQSAVLCGSLVAAAGAVIAAMVWAGRTVDGLQGPTRWILRILGNPLFWIGLLLIIAFVNQLGRRRSSKA